MDTRKENKLFHIFDVYSTNHAHTYSVVNYNKNNNLHLQSSLMSMLRVHSLPCFIVSR